MRLEPNPKPDGRGEGPFAELQDGRMVCMPCAQVRPPQPFTTAFDLIESDWIGLDWIGLDWVGLEWSGVSIFDWVGLDNFAVSISLVRHAHVILCTSYTKHHVVMHRMPYQLR